MNALEKLVDLFTACLLLFGIPLLYYGGKTELVRQMTAGRACESFLSRCSIFGEITDIFLGELEFFHLFLLNLLRIPLLM